MGNMIVLSYFFVVFTIVFVVEHQRLQKANVKKFELKAVLSACITGLVPFLFFGIYVFDVFGLNEYLLGNPQNMTAEQDAKNAFYDTVINTFIAIVIPIITYILIRKLLAKHLK